jgi:cobyrinic acid a,c-diamide synthase
MLLVCTVYCVLYSETAVSQKPFRIGHMYILTFFHRMTDTSTSQNIDLSSWNTRYIKENTYFQEHKRR